MLAVLSVSTLLFFDGGIDDYLAPQQSILLLTRIEVIFSFMILQTWLSNKYCCTNLRTWKSIIFKLMFLSGNCQDKGVAIQA